MGVTNHWTGTLDWTTGLTYFWFLHILRLVLLSLASQGPSENLQSATKMMSVRGGISKNLLPVISPIMFFYSTYTTILLISMLQGMC